MVFTFTVNQNPLSIAFDAGSVGEGLAILRDSESELAQVFAMMRGEAETADAGETAQPKPRRGRPPKAPAAAEAPSAVPAAPPAAPVAPVAPPAPPPAPVAPVAPPAPPPAPSAPPAPPAPPAAPVAPPDTTPTANGIPAFLNRTAAAPAPIAPPPPAPPVAAPAAERLADKVVRKLKDHAAASADSGKSLVDWLANAGAVVPGCTFDEAVAVVGLQKDEQVAQIATALGVQ